MESLKNQKEADKKPAAKIITTKKTSEVKAATKAKPTKVSKPKISEKAKAVEIKKAEKIVAVKNKTVKAKKPAKIKAPKPAKIKAPKPAKIKVQKKQKLKAAKIPKVKIKKVKRVKTKSLKKKILTIAISSVLILSLLLGIGSIFTLNDFAMTTILSGNVEKSLSIVDEAILQNFNSRYLDMKIECSASNYLTGEVTYFASGYLKVIKYDDNSFGFTCAAVVNGQDWILNYKNNTFYMHVPEFNYTSQNTQSARNSLMPLSPFLGENHILPTEASTVADFAYFNDVKNSFAFNTKPFYFGERFDMSYNSIYYEENEVYELDYLGNLRKRIYTRKQSNFIYKTEITYLSVNKIFELKYHPIFNL